jgi:hypothetical protein
MVHLKICFYFNFGYYNHNIEYIQLVHKIMLNILLNVSE